MGGAQGRPGRLFLSLTAAPRVVLRQPDIVARTTSKRYRQPQRSRIV
ncbi:hypothetical protein BN2537_4463 [Streptomyces venezuelae]|nr:hypothetical protein BN2537_4463 [Streptomyces venezuelae]